VIGAGPAEPVVVSRIAHLAAALSAVGAMAVVTCADVLAVYDPLSSRDVHAEMLLRAIAIQLEGSGETI
jgi:hypothetical protein